MTKYKKLLLIIIIITLSVLLYLWLSKENKPNSEVTIEDCQVTEEEKIVRGNSLEGFLTEGTSVKVLSNYYKCDKGEVNRDDVVLFSYAGNKDPLIKIVKAVPGDQFSLHRTAGGWNISINNQMLTNANGKPYLLDRARYEMLHLYEQDYGGTIPVNSYLILGNLVEGSMDSTYFGLVDESNIIAKAVVD